MKKTVAAFLLGALLVVLLGVAAFFTARTVFAQTPQPPDSAPYGPGMMGGGGYGGMMGGGMMRRGAGGMMNGAYGPMHEYMEQAFADQLGITVEDLEAQLDGGKTMYQVALDQGLTEEETWTAMQAARDTALDKMVADGVITSEQAQWMKDHMADHMGAGTGAGGCHGSGGTRDSGLQSPQTSG